MVGSYEGRTGTRNKTHTIDNLIANTICSLTPIHSPHWGRGFIKQIRSHYSFAENPLMTSHCYSPKCFHFTTYQALDHLPHISHSLWVSAMLPSDPSAPRASSCCPLLSLYFLSSARWQPRAALPNTLTKSGLSMCALSQHRAFFLHGPIEML